MTPAPFVFVEHTLDLPVPGVGEVRVWLDAQYGEEHARRLVEEIRSWELWSDVQLIAQLSEARGVTAFQIRGEAGKYGERFGTVYYTVPFEDIKG